MQIYREQTQVLEPKACSDSKRDWEFEQTENELMRPTHNQSSELWRTQQSDFRAHSWAEENLWKPQHQVSSSSSRHPS